MVMTPPPLTATRRPGGVSSIRATRSASSSASPSSPPSPTRAMASGSDGNGRPPKKMASWARRTISSGSSAALTR